MAMTEFGRLSRNRAETVGPQLLFAIAILIAGAAWLFAERNFGSDAPLPVVATLLFVLAAAAAALAWWRKTAMGDRVTYWDVASGLTFIGIGAGVLIDPDQLLRLIASAPAETEAMGGRR